MLKLKFFIVFCVFSIVAVAQNRENQGSNPAKKSLNGSTLPSKIKPADISECPVTVPIKMDGYELVTPISVPASKANLLRSTNTMRFDKILLNDIKLNVPAFRQFKNNKTDFTIEGDQQFATLAERVRLFLTTDNHGKPFSLKITGSASQIPTSYDPTKPNNNLRADGSSIPGQTNVANNRLLAKARADELAKKLKHLFPILTIYTPNIDEIKLGEQVWTKEMQKKLIILSAKRDKPSIEKLFEPFQKDQWVKVESADVTSKTIQPEAAKMYMVSTTPPLKTKLEGKEQSIKTIFIVSKTTFEKVGSNRTFANIAERDRFLKRFSLKIFHLDKDSLSRWYLLGGKQEIEAFNSPDYDLKIAKLTKVGINDIADQTRIQKAIEADLEKMYK
ncbi:MAG: hypothetical protein ACKVOU_09430 [Cytophagales bacterium]